MKPLYIKEIVNAVNGRINDHQFNDLIIDGVETDSRRDLIGKLFIPYKGERFDGHQFINQVLEAGAVCCLSENTEITNANHPIIYVASTKMANMELAKYYRGLFPDIDVIGITGSSGKTTTKDIIADVLKIKYKTLKTEGNFNNEIGLPLTMYKLEDGTQKAVIEMGMSDFGEIHNLANISRPKIGVITNIGVAHIENLKSKDGILKAKSEIFDFMDADTDSSNKNYAILNGDDEYLLKLKNKLKNVIYFGTNYDNDFFASDIIYNGIKGTTFRINKKTDAGILYTDVTIHVPGFHMILNSLAAAAVGDLMGLRFDEIKKGLENFQLTGMRMDITTYKGFTIINDAYNANPDSMKVAIGVLGFAEGRKIAVLGDMLELGKDTERYHKEVGAFAAENKIDRILCFGELSHHIYLGAKEANKHSDVLYFNDKSDMIQYLKSNIVSGDTVLIKASRGMRFEEIALGITE